MKFQRLCESLNLKEQSVLYVNQEGQKLIQQYRDLISKLDAAVVPIVQPYVSNPQQVAKEAAVQIISSINSKKLGTQNFEVMSRLDTITNGGQSPVDPNTFTFNQNDPILQFLTPNAG